MFQAESVWKSPQVKAQAQLGRTHSPQYLSGVASVHVHSLPRLAHGNHRRVGVVRVLRHHVGSVVAMLNTEAVGVAGAVVEGPLHGEAVRRRHHLSNVCRRQRLCVVETSKRVQQDFCLDAAKRSTPQNRTL